MKNNQINRYLFCLILLQSYSLHAVYDLDSLADFPMLQRENFAESPQTNSNNNTQLASISSDHKASEIEDDNERTRVFIRNLSVPPLLPNQDLITNKLNSLNQHFYTFQGQNLLNKIYTNQTTYDYGKVHLQISKAFHQYKQDVGDKYYQKHKSHIDALKKFLEWTFSIHGPEELKFCKELINLPEQETFLHHLEEFDAFFAKHLGAWLKQNLYKKNMTLAQANFILQQALTTYILSLYKDYFETGLGAALEKLMRAFVFQNHQDFLE